MIAPMVPLHTDLIVLAALPLLAAAALGDVAARRIPNRIPALLALLGLLRQGLAGFGALGAALAVAAAVLLGTVLLWQRGALGGGDVKLLAAASLLVSPALVPRQLLAVALAGGALALLHLALRPLLRGRPAAIPPRGWLRREALRIRRGAPLPYGVAVAIGTAWVLLGPEG